jgi:hypothetical protein
MPRSLGAGMDDEGEHDQVPAPGIVADEVLEGLVAYVLRIEGARVHEADDRAAKRGHEEALGVLAYPPSNPRARSPRALEADRLDLEAGLEVARRGMAYAQAAGGLGARRRRGSGCRLDRS